MNVLKEVLGVLTDDKPIPFCELEQQLPDASLNSLRRALIQLESTGRAALEPGRGWRRCQTR